MSYPTDKEYVIVESFILLARKKYGESALTVLVKTVEWLQELEWTEKEISYWISKFDEFEVAKKFLQDAMNTSEETQNQLEDKM
jgi:hypothetical protein